MTTTADEKRNEAREHIKQAYYFLQAACDPDTSGNDEYSKEYKATMEECLLKLIQIKRDL